jgi:hypothetical protein
MMRAELRHLGKRYLRGVPHEVANAAMEVLRRMVDVLAVFKTDQIGNLGWEERTAVPPGDNAAISLLGDYGAIFSLGDFSQSLVRVILQLSFFSNL